jgi:hypothetical protein
LRKLESDAAASKPSVDFGVRVESVINASTFLLIQNNLQNLAAILLRAETLANDLDGVNKVGENSVVDSGESPRAGPLLLLCVAGAARSLGLR